MDNLMYILFICIAVPMIMLLFLSDKKSRLPIAFMLIGITEYVFVAEVNGYISTLFQIENYDLSVTYAPIIEEFVKAFPILCYTFLFSEKKEKIISASMSVGIGFGVLENTYILVSDIQGVSIFWALIRGFGTGLMHGICTAMVGYGISFVKTKKKMFVSGTFALLAMAIIYHAIYNMLALSEYKRIGFIIPIVTYMLLLSRLFTIRKNKNERGKVYEV